MIVRRADPRDLEACLKIDGAYQTDHVWQMRLEEGDSGEITTSFQPVKLPRPMAVTYPRTSEDLAQGWERRECVLVAEEGGKILGYLLMGIQAWNKRGWVNDLVVARDKRRKGIGTALLRSALRWAEERKLLTVMVETQTKNYPAVSFLKKHGFIFAGFNDRYYPTQEIALFFAFILR